MSDISGYVLFFIWIALGFWGTWIMAKKKPGQRAFWILSGIYLVPLGICTFLAALFVPEQKVCPHCKSLINAKAQVCPQCGRDIEIEAD